MLSQDRGDRTLPFNAPHPKSLRVQTLPSTYVTSYVADTTALTPDGDTVTMDGSYFNEPKPSCQRWTDSIPPGPSLPPCVPTSLPLSIPLSNFSAVIPNKILVQLFAQTFKKLSRALQVIKSFLKLDCYFFVVLFYFASRFFFNQKKI